LIAAVNRERRSGAVKAAFDPKPTWLDDLLATP